MWNATLRMTTGAKNVVPRWTDGDMTPGLGVHGGGLAW